MELKPRYWMARLIIALEALMLIALPGLVAAMKGGTSSEHLRRAVSAYLKRAKVA